MTSDPPSLPSEGEDMNTQEEIVSRKPRKSRKKERDTSVNVKRFDAPDDETEGGEPEAEFQQIQRRGTRKRKATSSVETTMDISEANNDDTTCSSNKEAPVERPSFPEIAAESMLKSKNEIRQVTIPPNRLKALKEFWLDIYNPIVQQLSLQIRFNIKSKKVEIKTCKETKEASALQKAADFVRAFAVGFEVQDALAIVRLDDLFLESFQIEDVKSLKGDHLARAIGRIAGKGGKTKFTIENVTKTRIVLAESKIHLLGTYQNIAAARKAICSLILGSPPSKVYGTMRAVAAKTADRF